MPDDPYKGLRYPAGGGESGTTLIDQMGFQKMVEDYGKNVRSRRDLPPEIWSRF